MKNILLVDKPAGWTSFDVVAKIRGMIRKSYLDRGEKPTKRQLKVGHAGTLDPFATGLLVVLVGEACTHAQEFLKLPKTYEATFTLGSVSSTGDPEGELTPVSGKVPEFGELTEVAERFIGDILQRPPAYSAVKIDGKRAYNLARKGEVVEIPERIVHIDSFAVLDYTYPNVKVRTHVGSGTYIRSLAADFGDVLGTGAYCSELRRTQIGDMRIEDAVTIDRLQVTDQLNHDQKHDSNK